VATTVAERLALALENTRLFEQSQSQALRERKASEVATALIGATDVRVVLNMAAEQFKDALGAVNTRIYIQPETLMEPLAQTQGGR
jgi:GAF domain-containing protein